MKLEYDNLVFVFTLSPPIDYPPQELRYQKFGKPICDFVGETDMVFSYVDVEYYKDQNGKMDRIDVACFEPDEATAQTIATMRSTNQPLNEAVLLCFVHIYRFFKNFNTVAICEAIRVPQEKTSQEWLLHEMTKPLMHKGEWPIINKAGMLKYLEGAIKALSERKAQLK